MLDHFRAVATAIGAKVNRPRSAQEDEIGGGTRSFKVYPGHPHTQAVYALLREARERSRAVWERVSEYNEKVPPPEHCERVTFYFGQNVIRSGADAECEPSPTDPSAES